MKAGKSVRVDSAGEVGTASPRLCVWVPGNVVSKVPHVSRAVHFALDRARHVTAYRQLSRWINVSPSLNPILFLVGLGSLALAFDDRLSAAESDWRPKDDEPYVVGDPRQDALRAYREASVIMRVYRYINSKQTTPGDIEDWLLNDFQETIAARTFPRALDFLSNYPDSELAGELPGSRSHRPAGSGRRGSCSRSTFSTSRRRCSPA